jgi:hypothetical protein
MPRGTPRSAEYNDRSINLRANPLLYAPDSLFDDIEVSEETRRKWQWQAEFLVPRHQGSWNDPLTVTLVLDAILQIEPRTIIRSRRFEPILNNAFPRVAFEKQTVGRIINELSEIVMTCPTVSTTDAPLRLGRDYHGLLWEWDPTLANLAALYQMRDYIGALALLQSRDPNYNLTRTPSVWENFEWSDIPVR